MTQTINYPDGSSLTTAGLSQNDIQTALQIATLWMIGIIPSLVVQMTLTSGQVAATVISSIPLYAGLAVSGTGITAGTTISSVSGSNVTLSSQATVSGQQNITVADPQAGSLVRIGWPQTGQPFNSISQDIAYLRCETIDTDYSRLRDSNWSNPVDVVVNTDTFTRAWKTCWTFYGPNALNNAKLVKSALTTVPFIDGLLASNSLYVNPSIPEPDRFREEFQGQWWERVDMEAEFNEQITEQVTLGVVESVEVKIYDKEGEQNDFTVTTS